MKYHGTDLSWDLAELRLKCESVGQEDAKATRKAAMTCSDDVVARATIEFISCMIIICHRIWIAKYCFIIINSSYHLHE
jgi:hypothetical protein